MGIICSWAVFSHEETRFAGVSGVIPKCHSRSFSIFLFTHQCFSQLDYSQDLSIQTIVFSFPPSSHYWLSLSKIQQVCLMSLLAMVPGSAPLPSLPFQPYSFFSPTPFTSNHWSSWLIRLLWCKSFLGLPIEDYKAVCTVLLSSKIQLLLLLLRDPHTVNLHSGPSTTLYKGHWQIQAKSNDLHRENTKTFFC